VGRARCSNRVHFLVGDLELKPGDARSVRLGAGRTLAIRALAMTERRKFVKTKPLTAHVVSSDRDDYHFTYTIDTGAGPDTGTWKVDKETYRWTAPKLLLATRTPFEPGPAAPSSQKATEDVLTWTVPVISQSRFGAGAPGTQSFLIQVSGDLTWRFTREGTHVQRVERTEDETFHGELKISVPSE
jgi:hypothetical protein